MATQSHRFTELISGATRYLFFTGKGGVGKTSLACATAVALASPTSPVLLVSTDPASNLDEVLATQLSTVPTPVKGVPGLLALNLDPEAAAHAYRERVVGPFRGVLPDATIAHMEEQLSGGCTIEIAAFDEFAKLLGEAAATADFAHVIFDTAPTGHTLRLLQLPKAWAGFLSTNTGKASCAGPLAGLDEKRDLYAATVKALSDEQLTTVTLVSRPERTALAEADRARAELADLGITNQVLILNGVYEAAETVDPAAAALHQRGAEALATMPAGLSKLPRTHVPLQPGNIVGLGALQALIGHNAVAPSTSSLAGDAPALPSLATLADLVDELATTGAGVIMTMGKGGVGKTTVAAALAVELARRGFPVHLTTTDPAGHVASALGEEFPSLSVGRIDPAAETEAYREEVRRLSGVDLDEEGRALLDEELRSPCTEEIAVFRAFARTIAQGDERFVILDTAPTGHTLLLLDTTEAYHRQVARNAGDLPEEVVALLPRLRDPGYTRALIVTLPELTPVQEAQRLQDDLRRAGVTPFAWVINQSLSRTVTSDPLLQARGRGEAPFIAQVKDLTPGMAVLVPWSPEEPVGADQLAQLLQRALGGSHEAADLYK